MTEQLRTMMDRAADQDFAAVDLDAITGAGDRTVRRRQVATGVAGIAVLAVVATGAVLLGGDGGDRKTDFTDRTFETDVPMWTEGSTLHTPDQRYDLGVDVISFVRTSEGIVFMGLEEDETFGVYSYAGDEPIRIGETDDPHLRADADEPYVGWLDRSGGDDRAVIYDLTSGERAWSGPANTAYSFPIVAIDGTSAYLSDADEHPTRVVDLDSGEVTDLVGAERYFVDVEGDLTAYLLESRGGDDLGLEVRRHDGATVEIRNDDGGYGIFSPGGRWISAAAEDVSIYDTTTGDPIDIGALDDREGFGYEWADADTLMVIAESEADNEIIELLSCEIPAGACTKLMVIDDFSQPFSIGSSELLWGLATETGFSSEPPVEMEASPVTTETMTVVPE